MNFVMNCMDLILISTLNNFHAECIDHCPDPRLVIMRRTCDTDLNSPTEDLNTALTLWLQPKGGTL